VNRKRVQRLMQMMGIEVIYPRVNLSKANKAHKKYPYLLKNVRIEEVDFVWSSDITYIPLQHDFIYLTAVIDWFSRYVLTWKLSSRLESGFCIEALTEALNQGRPRIFNTDQGTQYTSRGFTEVLEKHEIEISMDGKGRAFDNIFIERLWRTVKYEEVYCKAYEDAKEAERNLGEYFKYYNTKRLHQALGYKTPEEIYYRTASSRLNC
jgi:putative transposase